MANRRQVHIVAGPPPNPEGTRKGMANRRQVHIVAGPPPNPEGTRKGMPLLYDENRLRTSYIVGMGLAPILAQVPHIRWPLIFNVYTDCRIWGYVENEFSVLYLHLPPILAKALWLKHRLLCCACIQTAH
jgi:hypothetical protein